MSCILFLDKLASKYTLFDSGAVRGHQLTLDEFLVSTILLNKLIVTALFDNLTVAEYYNLVRILDRRQPVRNDDDGLRTLWILKDLVKSLLNQVLGFGIKG